MEPRAFSRTAGINTHAACTHNPHEHSRGLRSKVCVNLCMGEYLTRVFLSVFDVVWASLLACVCSAVCRAQATERGGKRICQQRATVLITYRSNLADDSLKRQGAAQCSAQKEREETIYCWKVSRTLISASLNVYYQLLASEPCLAALSTASLSLPSYLTPLFSLFYPRSTLPDFILSFTSHLRPLTSHFFSPLDVPFSSHLSDPQRISVFITDSFTVAFISCVSHVFLLVA